MTCRELGERIVDHLYGELGAEEQAAFEAHLAGCPGCQREVASLGKARQVGRAAVRGALAEEPPARIREALLSAAAAVATQTPVRAGAFPAATTATSPDLARPTTSTSTGQRAPGEGPSWVSGLLTWLRRPWFVPAMVTAGAFAVFFVTRKTITNPDLVPATREAEVVRQVSRGDQPATAERRQSLVDEEGGFAKGAAPPAAQPVLEQQGEGSTAGPATRSAAGGGRPAETDRDRLTPPAKALRARRPLPEAAGEAAPREEPLGGLAGKAAIGRRAEADGFSGFGAGRAQSAAAADDTPQREAPRAFAVPPPEGRAANEAKARRVTEPVVAAAPARPSPRGEAPGAAAPASKATAEPAAPSPERAAPSAAEAPPPAPSAAPRADRKKEAPAADPAEALSEEIASSRSAPAAKPAPLSIDELERRAERALDERRYVAAAADLRELLRREPRHARAGQWRQRLEAALRAMDPRQ
jgi:hypothetical protein